MIRLWTKLTLAIMALALASTALAQTGATLLNPESWGMYWRDTASLVILIGIIVQPIKNWFVSKELTGVPRQLGVIAVSLAVGLLMGALGTLELFGFGPYYDGTIGKSLVFGLQAGFIASGAKAFVTSLLEKLGGPKVPA